MRCAGRVIGMLGADVRDGLWCTHGCKGKDGDCWRGVLKKLECGVVPGGGPQRTWNMRLMSVTPEVSQLDRS